MKLPWPRFRRLTKRAQFTACYDRGTRHYTRYFVVFARQAEADKPAPFSAAHNTAASPVGISGGSSCLGHGEFPRVHVDEGAHSLSQVTLPERNQPEQNVAPQCGRLGLAVTKKCGNAVQRNRIKRVLRAFFRLHQHEMPAMDIVVTPKRHLRADQIHLALVERDIVPLLANLRKSFPASSQASCAPAGISPPAEPPIIHAPTNTMPCRTDRKAASYPAAAPAATCTRLKSEPACGGPA